MDLIRAPKEAGAYRDRDIDCQEALQKPFRAVSRMASENMRDAAGGTLSPAMVAIAKRAVAAGWGFEEAEVAISELAQNILDEFGDGEE
ncbi:MAG: hypothetical protein ACOH2J_18590 [Allorhizobium sp.]